MKIFSSRTRKLVVFLFSLSFLVMGCGEEPQLPPCKYTLDGWVCADIGVTDIQTQDMKDSQKDIGLTADMASDMKIEDMKSDLSNSPAKTCGEIKVRGLPSGDYEIELNGTLQKVHCNSDVEGGGWMLIARSVAGASSTRFGWKQSTGSLNDDTIPYSLEAQNPSFKSVLVTNYSTAKTPGDHQYIIDIPNDFMMGCASKSCEATPTKSPTQSCLKHWGNKDLRRPGDGAGELGSDRDTDKDNRFMFQYFGFTNNEDQFFAHERSSDNSDEFGFTAGGWALYYYEDREDCKSGKLHKKQGLIFIR